MMTQKHKTFWHHVTRDLITALGVLALVFLSFGHQSIAVAGDGGLYVFANGDAASFCGNPPDGGSASGKGCDACRLSAGITYPHAPCLPIARFVHAITNVDIWSTRFVPAGVLNRVQDPRAPPLV